MFVVIHIIENFQHLVNTILNKFRGKKVLIVYARVKQLCESNGITVTELEVKLGFSRGSLCKWNTNTPSITKVKLVADYFGVTIDEFMKGVE